MTFPDGAKGFDGSSFNVELTAVIAMPPRPAESNSDDTSVIVEVETHGSLIVRYGEGPGRVHEDTIYQRRDPAHLIIRTDTEWGNQVPMVLPLRLVAPNSSSADCNSGVAVRVTIDDPSHHDEASWFNKTVRLQKPPLSRRYQSASCDTHAQLPFEPAQVVLSSQESTQAEGRGSGRSSHCAQV